MLNYNAETKSFEVTPKILDALLNFCSDDKTRENLCGITLAPMHGGIYLVGTNGHCLFRWEVNAPGVDFSEVLEKKPLLWKRVDLERAVKISKVDKSNVTLTVPEKIENLPTMFPEVERVWPKETGIYASDKLGFNSSYLAHLNTLAKAISGTSHGDVRVTSLTGETSPVVFGVGASGAEPEVEVVVMPVRIK